jgi:hypothetical protein
MRPFRVDSDYWLTMLTNLVLTGLGLLCVFGMFYYKAASAKPGWNVIGYQHMMNRLASPLVIGLCVLLVVCVPKRMLPGKWLALSGAALLAAGIGLGIAYGFLVALIIVLLASLGYQLATVGLLIAGRRMRFRKSGFLMQLGSVLIHAGFILFIMDFAMLHETRWHLPVFWSSTACITVGCLLSFYAPQAVRALEGTPSPPPSPPGGGEGA